MISKFAIKGLVEPLMANLDITQFLSNYPITLTTPPHNALLGYMDM